MEPERRAYLIANSPEWVLIAIAMWFAVRHLDVSFWLAGSVLALWILKDLMLYPMMRQYYRSRPSEQRMIGARGVVLSPLAPRGFVRVRGEIWQAEPASGTAQHVGEGTGVRVRSIKGLLLFVEPS